MISFQTTGDAPTLPRRSWRSTRRRRNGAPVLKAVKSIAPPAMTQAQGSDGTESDNLDDHYYPHASGGSAIRDTLCWHGRRTTTAESLRNARCGAGQEESCAVTVLDHFTSAFHWAEYNIAAIWLRHQWYLMTNSVHVRRPKRRTDLHHGRRLYPFLCYPGLLGIGEKFDLHRQYQSNPIPDPGPNPDPNKPETSKYAFTSNAGPFNAASSI